jgi:hypothetical protein
MLIEQGHGTYVGGPYDVLGIQHTTRGRYHVAFYEEKPMPGPVQSQPRILRLKSKMHHTEGAATFEEALEHLEEMAQKIEMDDSRIWRDRERVIQVLEAGPDVMILPAEAVV